jgi:hypothetical protein
VAFLFIRHELLGRLERSIALERIEQQLTFRSLPALQAAGRRNA